MRLDTRKANFMLATHARKQMRRGGRDLAAVVGRTREGKAPREQRIAAASERSRELELERYGSRADLVRAQPAANRFAMSDQRALELNRIEREIAAEGVFLAVRLALPVGDHGARVAPIGKLMQMRSRRAQARGERTRVRARQLPDRPDTGGVHPLERHPSHAPEPLDRQRIEKIAEMLRAEAQQAVRFRQVAQDLRDHLGRREADRHDQAGLIEHPAPERARHVNRRAEQLLCAGQIDKGFVERQRLDDRTETFENLADFARDLDIAAHPAADKDSIGTELAGLRSRHRGAHAIFPRFVRGRGHDPAQAAAADDYGLSAQLGTVENLDRRVERVHVGVRDDAHPRLARDFYLRAGRPHAHSSVGVTVE